MLTLYYLKLGDVFLHMIGVCLNKSSNFKKNMGHATFVANLKISGKELFKTIFLIF